MTTNDRGTGLSPALDANRTRIVEAMRRVLAGNPLHIETGRYSVLALAEESRVERNRFNREYSDLRDEFKSMVKAGTAAPEPSSNLEVSLADDLAETADALESMTQRYTEAREERMQWKEAAETFVRVIQTKDIEIAALQTDARTAKLRILRLGDELRDAKEAVALRADGAARATSGEVVQMVRRERAGESDDV
ncbi:hypothetical protein QN345_13160 [Cryobacterium sp. 10I1]|uniref:hypothetical protein n=1 Tax=unclassified Cryobacterium TaxID=2649013 RepID=UPI002B23ACEE|nr:MULTISPECIES: hypothetical protein [unclassified Cryobacterium]MEB0200379.1 hypothetical protein [Cryobacterium sp. 5I3]MEB0306252.1 hypothetical protein [Cryobacterium sp. 10I1]